MKKYIYLALVGVFAFTAVSAQKKVAKSVVDTIYTLKQVEITENTKSNKTQLNQPNSAVKINELELKRGTGLFMADAINTNVPGVFMENRTNSAGQQLNIRGYGNGMGIRGVNSNFDSQGMKMYLNGIPVTDAEGITVMDDIDFGSVSNVDISKGPAGTLYGLAIAGAVNLQTQKAEKNKTSIGQDFLYGSYGLLRSTTRLAIGGQKSSILLNYGHQEFDGYMVHTAAHKDFVNMMSDFELNSKQSISAYLGYSNSYDERQGELDTTQYKNMDYTGNPAYIKNNAHSAVRTFRAGIAQTYKFDTSFSNTTSLFGSAQSMDASSAGGWTDKAPLNYGFRSVFNKQFQLSDEIGLTGVAGLEMQKMNAQTIGYGMGIDNTDPTSYNVITSTKSNQFTTNSTASYFTQWTLDLPMGFSLNAGLGLSNMSIRLDDRLWAPANNVAGNTKLKVFEKSYTNLVSPNIAINKKIGETASVYASYSEAYKAPVSSNILISYTGQVNGGLSPEHGKQIEIGTKGNMLDNQLFYSVALFNTRFTNKFTSVAVANATNTATLYSYIVNGGSENNNGLEALVKYDLIKSNTGFFNLVRPFANITLSDFKYEDFRYSTNILLPVSDYSGKNVAGVSPLVYNVGVDVFTNIGVYANVNFNHRDAMNITSDNVTKTNAFSLLNAKIGYRKSIAHFDFDAYVGANNITSQQYYAMVFVNQLPDAFIPAPKDINYFGGICLKYNF